MWKNIIDVIKPARSLTHFFLNIGPKIQQHFKATMKWDTFSFIGKSAKNLKL